MLFHMAAAQPPYRRADQSAYAPPGTAFYHAGRRAVNEKKVFLPGESIPESGRRNCLTASGALDILKSVDRLK
jgi:hypothetical protein